VLFVVIFSHEFRVLWFVVFRASPRNSAGSKRVFIYMQLKDALLYLLLVFAPFAASCQEGSSPPPKAESATPATAASPFSNDQIRELIRQVAEKDMENDKKQRNYTYIERQEEHKLDRKGQLKTIETKTYEIMELYGGQVERLIAKDDKPLSQKDAAKEEEKIQKVIDKRKNESEDDRKKRLAKEEKSREEDRQFVREVADAYNFRLLGTEQLGGRDTWVFDADPRPGYQLHHKGGKYLPKFRFRAWIDKTEMQWAKLDVQCIDTVSWGLFIARIHKGSRIVIEQTQVNDEVWLPKHIALKLDARIALLKNFNVEEDLTYRDYKKFRTDTKIVPLGEAQETH
jgi:hypothetical protein